MNRQVLQQQVDALAALDGVLGCTLVEVEAGLPWCGAGRDDTHAMAEAATDYWRLTHRRSDTFGALGELRVQVLVHAQGRVTSVACPDDLLLVTVSAEPDGVDWALWKAGVGRLHAAIRAPDRGTRRVSSPV